MWSISSEHLALSAHVVVEDQSLAESEHVMRELSPTLCEKFDIGHTTIQGQSSAIRVPPAPIIWLSTTIPTRSSHGWPPRRGRRTPLSQSPDAKVSLSPAAVSPASPAGRFGQTGTKSRGNFEACATSALHRYSHIGHVSSAAEMNSRSHFGRGPDLEPGASRSPNPERWVREGSGRFSPSEAAGRSVLAGSSLSF